MLTSHEICCLSLRADICAADIAYQIVLKTNKGYCVDDLHEKLAYVYSLQDSLDEAKGKDSMTVKDGRIHFCGEKVLLSKNNPLLLTPTDACSTTVTTDECCTDLCEIEDLLSSVCINC